MAGNWKMYENHLEAIALVQKLAFTLTPKDFEAVEVAVLPPFTALRSVQTLIEGDKLRIAYGAQDLSQYDSGAYTGDVSGPILCLGESLEVRQAARHLGHCIGQLDGGLKEIPAAAVAAMVIAYEPVWAI